MPDKLVINLKKPMQASNDCLPHAAMNLGAARGVGMIDAPVTIRALKRFVTERFGVESLAPDTQEKLFQIFNHRYNHRMPTVVTTNRPPESIDPRIWSRMFDATLSRTVQLDTVDYRARPSRERRGPIRPTSRGSTPRR